MAELVGATMADEERDALRLGTPFQPHEVGARYIIHFKYDEHGYFEVYLEHDGSLRIRNSRDLLSIEPHVENECFIRARRWNTETERYEPLVKEVREADDD